MMDRNPPQLGHKWKKNLSHYFIDYKLSNCCECNDNQQLLFFLNCCHYKGLLYFPFAAKYSVIACCGSKPARSAFSQRIEMSESDFTYFSTPSSCSLVAVGYFHTNRAVFDSLGRHEITAGALFTKRKSYDLIISRKDYISQQNYSLFQE